MLAQRRRYDAAPKSAHHSASMKQRTTLNITPNLESLKETAVAFQTQTRSDDCTPRQRRTAKEARGEPPRPAAPSGLRNDALHRAYLRWCRCYQQMG